MSIVVVVGQDRGECPTDLLLLTTLLVKAEAELGQGPATR